MRSKSKPSPQTVPFGGNAGGGASHASKSICLTIDRTSPQTPKDYLLVSSYSSLKSRQSANAELNKLKARIARKELSAKKFRMKLYASSFCASQKLASFEVRNSKLEVINKKPSRCKSWSCPSCAPYNARSVRMLIEKVAILNSLEYFFTLTLAPSRIPLEYKDNTHAYITLLFNKLILYLKREFKFTTPLRYIWVMEYQKNGNAHMHGMWNQRIDVNRVRAIWVAIGGGQQMFVSKARDLTKTARYVSKYLTKALNSDYSDFYYFQKRYAISQNCIRNKARTISSMYSWEELVYHSYFLTKDYLSHFIDLDDEYPSFSFNFFDPNKNTASKKPT